ncbi:MAG: PA14 domain-containing protein [Nevskia sp.]|nr:PA14 domain-containing protein [Nevskia sp.]
MPWHLSNAELRVPVKVEVNAALLRMPPQVYVADLKLLESTDGLAFDPLSKDVIRVDIRDPKEKAATIAKEKAKYKKAGKAWDPKAYGRMLENEEGGPMLRVKGSVTVALKPEYKFFTWRSANGKVFIDGKLATPIRIGSRHWQRGEIFWPEHGKVGRREGVEVPGGRDVVQGGLVTIPAGAKTLKLERVPGRWHHHLRQAGFITQYPKVAHATISFPGRDPRLLVPVVHRANGQRVGCRVVWASESEPMTIMFDSSSGDEDYWVYLLDQAKAPAPLDWRPQAEIIQEIRQLDRYNPEAETLAGFEKVWASAAIVGRGIPQTRPGEGRLVPRRTIYQGTPPFRQKGSKPFNLHELAGSQPATLGRFSGTFHIPATGFYRLFCMSGPGGYVLLDGQLIASFRGVKSGRLFAIEIEKGQHRIEMLQYGPTGQVGWAGLWWKDLVKDLNGDYTIGWPKFGQTNEPQPGGPRYMLWEPLADTMTAPLEHRSKDAWATFSWYQLAQQKGVYPGIGYPKYALNWYRFSADAPGASADAVYRWEFDDGSTAEGKQISKLFLRSGIRKVQLEVLDAPGGKVVARAAGEVTVQMSVADWHGANLINWHNSRSARESQPGQELVSRPPFSPLVEQLWAFGKEDRLERLPLDDLVNFYEWLNRAKGYLVGDTWTPPKKHDSARMTVFDHAVESYRVARRRSRDVLAARVDELIAAYPYSELLRLAQGFSRAERRATDARYAAAEKLLVTVLERAPAGSSYWRAAALALSDIRLSVRGDTESAAAWLEKFEQTEAAVDMLESWQFSEARQYHHLADTDKLAGLTAGLDWSPIERPRHRIGYNSHHYAPIHGRTPQQAMSGWGWNIPFKNNRGHWLARDFDLPADWKSSQLVFEAGLPSGARVEQVWINGQPLGRMWQWLNEQIVIPAKLLKKGGKNRITWLLQPLPWAPHVQAASPAVFADLSLSAYGHDGRIQLMKGRHLRRDLGQLMVVGAVHDTPRSLAFSPDGKQLASGHQYGSVRVWDVDQSLEKKSRPKASHMISIGTAGIVSVTFSPDGKRLAAGSEDYRITLLDPISGQVLRSFVGHEADVFALAFSPDGTRLASASHDRTVKIWEPSSGKELLTLAGHAGPVWAVVYSPDGKSIATATDNARIQLWDAITGKPLRTLEGQQGEVLSLAFSPDGKRLAAGYREGVISQWDLESDKRLTMSPQRTVTDIHTQTIRRVMYSLDGKELVSIGGGSARKWDSGTGSGGESFAQFKASRKGWTTWLPPSEGLNRLADGFENYPVGLYTSEACQQQGMNFACYEGKWEKLPDFEALKPVKQGVLSHFDQEHLNGISLPYHKTVKKDGKDHRTTHPSALKATGYLKVEKAGDYTFSLQSADASRLEVGSKVVIESEGQENIRAAAEVKHGTVHLGPGVHPVTLSYLNARGTSLNVVFPREFVRSLTRGEIDKSQLMAGVLLAQGKREQAKLLLIKLHRGGWPLSEEEYRHVEQARMRIRRLSRTMDANDHSYGVKLIKSSLVAHPMLRLDPEFMVSAIAVYATLGDARAAVLAEQMLEADMNDGQRRLLIMTQVKIKLNEDDLTAAGKVYRKLKKLAPQSDETIEARELIRAAVIKRKK